MNLEYTTVNYVTLVGTCSATDLTTVLKTHLDLPFSVSLESTAHTNCILFVGALALAFGAQHAQPTFEKTETSLSITLPTTVHCEHVRIQAGGGIGLRAFPHLSFTFPRQLKAKQGVPKELPQTLPLTTVLVSNLYPV